MYISILHYPKLNPLTQCELLPSKCWPVLLAFPFQLLKMLSGVTDVDEDGFRWNLELLI